MVLASGRDQLVTECDQVLGGERVGARLTLAETLAGTLADSRVMATRQLRKILRRPMYVVYLFVQPAIFVLLFRYVFGGAINTGHVSYVDYLMPGIIVMTAVFGALTTGLGLVEAA